jgi:hypothetical protein
MWMMYYSIQLSTASLPFNKDFFLILTLQWDNGGAIDPAFTNHQWRLIMLEYISKKYINLFIIKGRIVSGLLNFLNKILNSLKNNLPPKLIIMASVLL